MKQFLRSYPNCCAALTFALLATTLVLLAGKDLDWDLFNYHYYNGWAWLQQRDGLDIAAAQLQTYYNPLLDVPLYLAIRYLPPWLVGVAYAMVASLNCWLVWRLARALLPRRGREGHAFVAGLLTLTGAIFHSELGGGMGDILFSLPLLLALLVLVEHGAALADGPWLRAVGWLALAGGLAGLAGGLKLVALIYALGFGLSCAALGRRPAQWIVFPLVFGTAALVGWLLLDGAWMWQLWLDFANPFFPLFNSVFGSPFASTSPLQDGRFLPKSAAQALFYPLYWLLHPRAVSDVGRFFDLRLPLLFVLGLVWLSLRSVGRAAALTPAACFVLGGIALSYLAWLGVFGIYRYLAPLELLAPLALLLLLAALGCGRRVRWTVLLLVGLVVVPLRWGRGDWSADYFEARFPPSVAATTEGLVLLGTTTPSAFLAPLLPASLRYVRVASNFHGATPGTALDRAVQTRIDTYRGPLFGLFNAIDTQAMDTRLAQLALEREASSCVTIDTVGSRTRPVPLLPEPFVWCALRRK